MARNGELVVQSQNSGMIISASEALKPNRQTLRGVLGFVERVMSDIFCTNPYNGLVGTQIVLTDRRSGDPERITVDVDVYAGNPGRVGVNLPEEYFDQGIRGGFKPNFYKVVTCGVALIRASQDDVTGTLQVPSNRQTLFSYTDCVASKILSEIGAGPDHLDLRVLK